VYEILLGAKKINGGGSVKRMIMDNLSELENILIMFPSTSENIKQKSGIVMNRNCEFIILYQKMIYQGGLE
jgi:hypothetical protein